MSSTKRSIYELDLLDDFLFTEASMDKQTSDLLIRLIVERALGVKIGKLIIEAQKTVNGVDTDFHGIRMDVSIKEVTDEQGKTIRLFDIEPNNIKKVHLPKRSRFYQALLDVKELEAGVDYDQLPDMLTIWILPYDPFGKDCMLYSVKNVVEDHPGIEYNDGIRKLFLYTGGKKGGTKALKNLLIYLERSIEENAVDEELKKLHSSVKRLKSSRKIGVKYMNMQEVMKYKIEEAVEEAVKEAVDVAVKEAVDAAVAENTREVTKEVTKEVELRMSELTGILLKENRLEDLKRMTVDEVFRRELLGYYFP